MVFFGFFWVGFLLPTLVLGGGGCRRGGDGGGHQHGLPHLRAGGDPLWSVFGVQHGLRGQRGSPGLSVADAVCCRSSCKPVASSELCGTGIFIVQKFVSPFGPFNGIYMVCSFTVDKHKIYWYSVIIFFRSFFIFISPSKRLNSALVVPIYLLSNHVLLIGTDPFFLKM